jgi:hypothetical protein
MRKLIISGMAVAMLAVPAIASADQPGATGVYTNNVHSLANQDMMANGLDTTTWLSNGEGPFKGSATGEYASRVIHNGWSK